MSKTLTHPDWQNSTYSRSVGLWIELIFHEQCFEFYQRRQLMKKNMILSLLIILIIGLIAPLSFAKSKSASKSNTEPSGIKFGLVTSLSYEQNAEPSETGIRGRGMGLYVSPRASLNNFTLRTDLIYVYDLNDPREGSSILDGVVALSYKGWKLGYVNLSPFTSIELPFSEESRVNREIKYVNNVGLSTSLDTKAFDLEKLSLGYGISFGYYTNEFTTRLNGEPATEYKIVQNFQAGYDFNPISIGFRFQFSNAYSYDDVVRSGYLISESISYSVSDQLSYSLYHYNRAPFLKNVTYENNLKAYDKTTSTLGISVDLSI